MGDYFIKTLLIFFFIAAGIALIANADNGLFDSYYDDTIRQENDNWYNAILDNIVSFESVAGAIFTGGLLYLAGASTTILVAGFALGAIIPIILDSMNILNSISMPIEVQYIIYGISTMLLITFVWRSLRGN